MHSRVVKNKGINVCGQTQYSRLDIMHHLRYDGTYRLSLFMEMSQGVDVNYGCPVCCRDMFHKDLSTATESAVIFLSTAREMMYFTKANIKRSYFPFASPPTTESPGHDHFKQLPTPGPEGLELSLWCPRGSIKSTSSPGLFN